MGRGLGTNMLFFVVVVVLFGRLSEVSALASDEQQIEELKKMAKGT